MTEEIASTPGWVDERLDELFAGLPGTAEVRAARDAYGNCLATRKAPAAPSDMLGAEFEPCVPALRRRLAAAGVDAAALDRLSTGLETLEAEVAADS